MSVIEMFAAALLVLAASIVARQARAGSCPRHSRVAGALAWLLALGCAGAGLWLLLR